VSTLTLSHDGTGRRHFVDGKPVHCGTGLQWSPDYGKTWINVRYEANFSRDGVYPVLYLPDRSQLVPTADSKFRWPNGSGCHSITRSARPIKIKVLPDEVLKKLEARRGHYSDMVSVFYVVCFEEDLLIRLNLDRSWLDSYAGVAGDGDNGTYEWFIHTPRGGLETSDCGYGDTGVALREVLNRIKYRPGEAVA
jgi:hypothetical protein